MTKLFISHSSQDDAFVSELRAALALQGADGWIDSRELRGGDPLLEDIQKAIEDASAYAVVVSPNAFQSDWVGDELAHAMTVQKERGRANYPVIPLALDGTKLGVFKQILGKDPLYISVSSGAGGVEAAMNGILVALGKRLPSEVPAMPQPKAEPLEELVLELTDLKFHEKDGVHRASARARLIYEPATHGQPEVKSAQSWRLIAPIGPIEAEDLRWYLEKYAIWPSKFFQHRARNVEENLVKWGQLLHDAAMPLVHTANVREAWAKIGEDVGRRFSIYVDTTLEEGMPEDDVKSAKEAATLLLALPWELLHDGNGYLFQGARAVRVRRRLPNLNALDVPVVATPIRILLVTARPEDDSCGYIDHRASALPLVEAMESLPGLVKIHVLSPPTLPALDAELKRTRKQKEPYHVVHFDGHGVFDREVGLGGLCFENPEDTGKLERRRHSTVFTKELGPLLRAHRIPLVFLEACQTAQAEKASESVASELLKVGVASVVAMSYSVLVETAKRFVEAFYEALALGERVGDAMLEGQQQLKDDTFRGRVFGAGELRLEDWFVPVLYQEKDDPQLFNIIPTRQTQEDFQAALATRLGHLPPAPETGFIGRSRELLALQRLLRHERYAVVRGQGGEGKTALAAEFARWTVRSQQIHRAAFVSVESNGNKAAIVDALGKQLVKKDFSAAGDLEQAILELERVLREEPTLLVVDNMESVLLPPFMEKETPEALSEDARDELKAILALCERLLKVGDTRLIFTSREALPVPFAAERHRRELFQLGREDAVKLVERVMNAADGGAGASSEAAREEIEQLVDAVNCHARTLALLAPSLRERGVAATRESLIELMAEMEQEFPASREQSVFASVELSLRRMSQANRDRARVLGVFHGGVNLALLQLMMDWQDSELDSLADDLISTGLATPNRFKFLALNPALCPYLRRRMDVSERESLTARWMNAMCDYVEFLRDQEAFNPQVAATLTLLELPNLFAQLNLIQSAGDTEKILELATSLYSLLSRLGKPRLLEHLGRIRDANTAALGNVWSNASFQAAQSRIEQQLDEGRLPASLTSAQALLQRAQAAGEHAYVGAEYDLATAFNLLGQVVREAGAAKQALALLEEAQKRFEVIVKDRRSKSAERMVSVCLGRKGECLRDLGRLDESATAFEDALRGFEQAGDQRSVAAIKGNLGWVRLDQHRYQEALAAYAEARDQFTQLDEPGSVAIIWHQMGMAYQEARKPEAAEEAYRKSLEISVQLNDVTLQAGTLNQLGILYDEVFGRLEQAAAFFSQAVDRSVDSGNVVRESTRRANLADTLRKLKRFNEAREQINQAIASSAQIGHTANPWLAWTILANIEAEAGNPHAATKAKRKALELYLDYRREGGENHASPGRISHEVIRLMLAGQATDATVLLGQLAAQPNGEWLLPFLRNLQAIITGNRDRSLAEDPELNYMMGAEILFVIENLERSSK